MSNILYFDTINSTNTYLKDNYKNLNNLTSVVAHHQTNGKGRLGRMWLDQDDLLMSILIKEEIINFDLLSLLMASVIYKVLSKYVNNIKIKWPNDIVISNKKICGILLEGVSSKRIEAIIIGFGINANTTYFNKEIINKATSLYLETKNKIDIKKLSQEIYDKFVIEFDLFKENKSDYLEMNRKNSNVIGELIKYTENDKEYIAKVVDILDNGHLKLLIDNKYLEKSFGEISLHNNY